MFIYPIYNHNWRNISTICINVCEPRAKGLHTKWRGLCGCNPAIRLCLRNKAKTVLCLVTIHCVLRLSPLLPFFEVYVLFLI